MRLREIKVGQQFMVDNPARRQVKVLREDTWEKPMSGGRATEGALVMTEMPCLVVAATIPTVPIDGVITANVAKQGLNIRHALRQVDEDDDFDARIWHEVWCERSVGKLVKMPGGGAVKVSESATDQVPQVYCEAILTADGRVLSGNNPEVEGSPLRSSGIHGASVEPLALLNQKSIHGDAFSLTPEPEPEPEKVKA